MPIPTVLINIIVGVKSGCSPAIKPLNAIGKLNKKPMTIPLIAQWPMRQQLMPMAKPIRVRLAIIWAAIGQASS